MFRSNVYPELRDMQRARLQRKFMHLLFSHLAVFMGALAFFFWFAASITK